MDERYDEIVASGQNILAETDRHVVLPSIGALCPGHVLLVTKEHVPSFRTAQVSGGVNALVERFSSIVSEVFESRVVVFEHANGDTSYCKSACVDHAHIHIVPTQGLLRPFISHRMVSVCRYYDLPPSTAGYTYLRDADGSEHVMLVNESQYLRKVWCMANAPIQWNWRLDHRMDNVIKTKEAIAIGWKSK